MKQFTLSMINLGALAPNKIGEILNKRFIGPMHNPLQIYLEEVSETKKSPPSYKRVSQAKLDG